MRNSSSGVRKLVVLSTAYKGNSKRQHTGDRTTMGTDADTPGFAVDPRIVPLGSRVRCPELDEWLIRHGKKPYGWQVADDTGGKIKGHRADMRLLSESDCDNWGKQTVTIEIASP